MIIMCTNGLKGEFTKGRLYDMKMSAPALAQPKVEARMLVENDSGTESLLSDTDLSDYFCMSWFGRVEKRYDTQLGHPYNHWHIQEMDE